MILARRHMPGALESEDAIGFALDALESALTLVYASPRDERNKQLVVTNRDILLTVCRDYVAHQERIRSDVVKPSAKSENTADKCLTA